MRRVRRLVRRGYDPKYGARPLKRAIQREIETPLAKRILGWRGTRTGKRVWIDADPRGSSLAFRTEATKPQKRRQFREAK